MSQAALQSSLDPANEVFLSAASSWEIAIKASLGRLTIKEPAWQLVPRERNEHRIASLPIDEESVLQTEKIPRLHSDPFDRMLVCQSIVHGLTIVTPDPLISQYPVRIMW
jgi:PIN domain nuclease of toxin-antitoxin system